MLNFAEKAEGPKDILDDYELKITEGYLAILGGVTTLPDETGYTSGLDF